ncbi:tetratricopeptide repeat-containing sulfotransferase family protein [Caulobacter sp. NIBR2454]|uniref:tetratricopeptide repeat-containing sulfotransferase family protein n=1 Tax=Caulobacter sp. NIBR2454 TaxID=3015996 RepID=UPI0022B71395|nr:tetratricopeptide repeat-containing sulfotransferase family protein [Caulobacter sp. NIBR2454]
MIAIVADTTLDRAEHLLAQGAAREAHALCLDALRRDPGVAQAWFLLGIIAAEHGNHGKAAELLEKATALAPAMARAHAHLGRTLVALNRQDLARQAADRAASLSPGDALTLDTIGVVYSRTGFHDRAIGFFERAFTLQPSNASFAYNLASARQFIGDFAGAETAYAAALDLDPGYYKAWSSRVVLTKQTLERNFAAQLEALFDPSANDPDPALHVGHALAKTYEDLGDHPTSLSWLNRAKAAKRRQLAYDGADDVAIFAAAARTAGKGEGDPSNEPIFVVGLPRTGTTLVDRILSSHPEVTSAGELSNFALIAKRMTGTPSNRVLDAETLKAATSLDMAALGRAYIDSTRPLTTPGGRFVDKMPLNAIYAGLIHRALPNARIVCLRRDPMDSVLSNYRQLFATGFSYYNYAYDLADTARYYVQFDRLVAHWRHTLPTDRFTEVAYEDLIADQEGETRRLLSFCGLNWDERCLAFHENPNPVATASSVQVRSPLHSGSIGRWKRYGDAVEPALAVLRGAGIAPQ